MEKYRILVVEDEETIRHILVNVLEENDCEVREVGTAEEGLAMVPDFKPAVAMIDIVLPGMNGLDLLTEIKKISPATEVVMMTSHSSAETALRAIRGGAYTYLQKPFEDLDEIWTTVYRALEKRDLVEKKRTLLQQHEERTREISSDVSVKDAGFSEDDFSAYAEILEFFMEMVTKELDVERANLMLLDEQAGFLRIASSRGGSRVDPKTVVLKLGEGIAGKVAETGQPFLGNTAKTINKRVKVSAPEGPDAHLAAPIALSVAICSDQTILGVFNVSSRRSGKPFKESDVTHLAGLGNQLALAIEGARRAETLQKAYESLKTTQAQLVRTERIKAIGQMAAGVAHDFNNALSVILARSEFILKNLVNGTLDRDKTRSDLETIIKTALQGAETIKRIQDYTRIRRDAPSGPVDVNAAIKDAIEITRPRWKQEAEAKGHHIEMNVEVDDIPEVTGNVHELTQVIENLIFNGIEAMPKGGSMWFSTKAEGDTVIVEVSDTGIGMDEKIQRYLFEPFFTTKETGQGLGMSIIYGIISRHRGTVDVRSAPGEGTMFTIRLPRYVPGAHDAEQPTASAAGTARSARILLVEDEDAVRAVYAEALIEAGHQVEAVSDGEAAISIFEKGKFDLVITDLSMDGMSGFEVSKEVKKQEPAIPVILLSGWAIEQQEDEVRQAGIDSILIKPCLLDTLRDAVQKALNPDTGSEARVA
ncbi:MAG: response regulator [Acidobacteria bacterium]|nr:response regulator [Acidobacteriota bacterium]